VECFPVVVPISLNLNWSSKSAWCKVNQSQNLAGPTLVEHTRVCMRRVVINFSDSSICNVPCPDASFLPAPFATSELRRHKDEPAGTET
jgi:hypothetical protein